MTPRLQDEIRQTKPFASLEEEAYLSLERTTAVLRHHLAEQLKAFGITGTQLKAIYADGVTDLTLPKAADDERR